MDSVKSVIWEAVILSVDTAVLAVCLRQLFKWKTTLKALDEAPTLEVDGNLKKRLDIEPENTLKYVVIRGIVKPIGNVIRSTSNDKITGVVQKLSVKEHVVSRTPAGFWSEETRTIYEIHNVMPFVISGKKVDVEIIDALEAKFLDLDLISDHFEPLIPSFLDHIWGYFMGLRQRGMQTTEEMLRDGTLITAIGELSAKDAGRLKLQPPRDGTPLFLISSTKSTLIKKIKESQNVLKLFAFVFGSIAIVLSSHMLYKYIKNRRKKVEENRLKKQLAENRRKRKAIGQSKDLSQDQLCVVCFENPKEVILLPCGHVSLCENCSDNITDKCPVCRNKIESKNLAFIM